MKIVMFCQQLYCEDCRSKKPGNKTDGLLEYNYKEEREHGSFRFWSVDGFYCPTCGKRWKINYSTTITAP
jgi:hypothetical protein